MPGLFICLILQLHVDGAADGLVGVDLGPCCGGNFDGWRRGGGVRRRRGGSRSRSGLVSCLSSVVLVDQLAEGVCHRAADVVVGETFGGCVELRPFHTDDTILKVLC